MFGDGKRKVDLLHTPLSDIWNLDQWKPLISAISKEVIQKAFWEKSLELVSPIKFISRDLIRAYGSNSYHFRNLKKSIGLISSMSKHGGSKEQEKQLWKKAVFQQILFSIRELLKTIVIKLIFKYYIRLFIQTNLLNR